MLLTRNKFFFLMGILVVPHFLLPEILWIANSTPTVGEMRFTGHGNMGSVL
jgi:hypothetical protein